MTLTFDLLTLKVVSQSRVTWATPVPILVFLGLSLLKLRPMYATDRRPTDRRPTDRRPTDRRQTDRRQTDRCQTKASLNAPPIRGGGIITVIDAGLTHSVFLQAE